MRFVTALALAVALAAAGCSDDDEPRAAATTTTSTSTESTSTTAGDDPCAGADPVPPTAADGSAAPIVASSGDLHFAVVDHGASVDVVGVYRTVDCAFEPVLLDGTAAALAVGGSVTHGEGLRCDGGLLTVLSATSDDGATYQATSVTYELRDDELVEVDRSASTIEAGEIEPYYRLDCGEP